MRNQPVDRSGPPASLIAAVIAAASITLCCVAACGKTTVSGGFLSTTTPQGNGILSPGYAYIASASAQEPTSAGTIYQYAVAADGSLSPLGVPMVQTGVEPRSIIADPTGRFLYTASRGDNSIEQFSVGAAGTLAPLLPASVVLPDLPPLAENYSLSVDPAGPYLYVVVNVPGGLQSQTVIEQFSIGPNGTLAPLIPAFVSVPASASGALAIDPTGANAYLGGNGDAAGTGGGGVFQFAIGADGSLRPLAPPSVPTSGPVVGIAFAPSGSMAYVLSECVDSSCDGSIAPYAIASTGVLSPAGAATLTGAHVNPVDLILDGSGSSAYLIANAMGVDTSSGSVHQYRISGTGAFTPGMPPSFPLAGAAVAGRTLGPDLYVLSGPAAVAGSASNDAVAIFSIGSGGALTSVGSIEIAAARPTGMALVLAH